MRVVRGNMLQTLSCPICLVTLPDSSIGAYAVAWLITREFGKIVAPVIGYDSASFRRRFNVSARVRPTWRTAIRSAMYPMSPPGA